MMTIAELATCSCCGHAADAHAAHGCRLWLPGTASDPPGPCGCALDTLKVFSKIGPPRPLRLVV
jgi:hypothetical protein